MEFVHSKGFELLERKEAGLHLSRAIMKGKLGPQADIRYLGTSPY